jgi:hypothetical protein
MQSRWSLNSDSFTMISNLFSGEGNERGRFQVRYRHWKPWHLASLGQWRQRGRPVRASMFCLTCIRQAICPVLWMAQGKWQDLEREGRKTSKCQKQVDSNPRLSPGWRFLSNCLSYHILCPGHSHPVLRSLTVYLVWDICMYIGYKYRSLDAGSV